MDSEDQRGPYRDRTYTHKERTTVLGCSAPSGRPGAGPDAGPCVSILVVPRRPEQSGRSKKPHAFSGDAQPQSGGHHNDTCLVPNGGHRHPDGHPHRQPHSDRHRKPDRARHVYGIADRDPDFHRQPDRDGIADHDPDFHGQPDRDGDADGVPFRYQHATPLATPTCRAVVGDGINSITVSPNPAPLGCNFTVVVNFDLNDPCIAPSISPAAVLVSSPSLNCIYFGFCNNCSFTWVYYSNTPGPVTISADAWGNNSCSYSMDYGNYAGPAFSIAGALTPAVCGAWSPTPSCTVTRTPTATPTP